MAKKGFTASLGGRPVSQAYFDNSGADTDVSGAMYDARAVKDNDETSAGKRFMDNGSRIPGNQKARNDQWEAATHIQKVQREGQD